MSSKKKYKSQKLSNDLIERDFQAEQRYGIERLKLYAYKVEEELNIKGQIFSKSLSKPFCIMTTLYDSDGDILETSENSSFGTGLVTSMIQPESFFNGFPFSVSIWGVDWKSVARITIAPSDSY